MSALHHAAIILSAMTATWIATPIVRRLAIRWGIVARPGGRHIHATPTPKMGGVAMFFGFAAALLVQALGERFADWRPILTRGDSQFLGALAGLVVVFIVGILDDVVDLSPGMKFVGQLLAASVAVAAGVRIDFLGNPFGDGIILLGILAIPLTLLWMLGFTNVINLIDGMDGLAAGVTGIAAVSFLILADQASQFTAAVVAAALIGACLGFLRYNFSPASIFMGDSGALFIGFALACISVLGVMKSVAAITLAVPLLIVGVPLFDTVSAIIRRRRHGRPIQEADRGHIHHRLLGRGFNTRQTVLIIYAWSAMLAIGGHAIRWVPGSIRLVTLIVLAALSGLMAHWLGLFEAAHHHHDGE